MTDNWADKDRVQINISIPVRGNEALIAELKELARQKKLARHLIKAHKMLSGTQMSLNLS